RASEGCEDGELGAALAEIADDEARHAALAWSTLAWALRAGGARAADALERAAAEQRPPGVLGGAGPAPATSPRSSALARHGRMDVEARARAVRDAWALVIAPLVAELLAA